MAEKYNWEDFIGFNSDEIEQKAKEILSKLTVKQKVFIMSGDWPFIGLRSLYMAIRYNFKPIPAGRIKKLGIPGILFSDGPRGIVMNHSTCFPVSMARGATWDPTLEEAVGNAIGTEGKSQGANYYGGVCINLLRHPAWGRAQETYGEDPYHLGEMGAALVRGVQKHMMACAKHYACNSIENARFKVDVKIDERTLREIYTPHFKRCVDEGAASIMSSYNQVNGKYSSHNEHLLKDIAKNDWNFKGFILSDFTLAVRDGIASIHAGLDVEMPNGIHMRPKQILRNLKRGKNSIEEIDDSVLRILRQMIRFARKNDPNLYNKNKVACKEHTQLALEVARKSIVLLKNENNILPLDKSKLKKIVVVGNLANKGNIGDQGSSCVYPPYIITPLEGIKKVLNISANSANLIEVQYNNGKKIDESKELCKNADVVIIVAGYIHKHEGEFILTKGGDRRFLTLLPHDERLIQELIGVNKNCIVIMEGGSAIITESWKDRVPVILMAWYPGMEGGNAIAEILFGITNPSGKLPCVFPKSPDQLPFFNCNAKSIEYGYFHGYRLLDKNRQEPAFPFGFGLSYTKYEYSNMQIDNVNPSKDDTIKISVDVKNIGRLDGEEIVQLYVGYENSRVERVIKELKGFQRVKLTAGEKKTVTIKLKIKDTAYYDVDKKDWIVESIPLIIYIGSSSKQSDLLSKKIQIK